MTWVFDTVVPSTQQNEKYMTQAQSTTHLSCFIEAIALAKHTKCASRDDLKILLQQKGYEELVALDTAYELGPNLPFAS